MLPSDAECDSCLRRGCIYSEKNNPLSGHMNTTRRRRRGICFCWCVCQIKCIESQYASSAIVIGRFFLKEGKGSNPIFMVLACVQPVPEIPPPSCVDYLHCSNGISSHTDCKPVSLQDGIVLRQEPVPSPHCQTKMCESFEKEAITACVHCGLDLIINMTIPASSAASTRKCNPQKIIFIKELIRVVMWKHTPLIVNEIFFSLNVILHPPKYTMTEVERIVEMVEQKKRKKKKITM